MPFRTHKFRFNTAEMAQERLNNDEFLARLTSLLNSTHAKSSGSIYLTQKPLLSTSDAATTSQNAPQILIRATNGIGKPKKSTTPTSKTSKSKSTPASSAKPKIKFATLVDVTELEGFYARYAEVCKKGMEGLRKRDKKKAKERAKAKKKGKAGS